MRYCIEFRYLSRHPKREKERERREVRGVPNPTEKERERREVRGVPNPSALLAHEVT